LLRERLLAALWEVVEELADQIATLAREPVVPVVREMKRGSSVATSTPSFASIFVRAAGHIGRHDGVTAVNARMSV
jgi:hypothetical protein